MIVAAPVTRPFTSMKRSLPVPGTAALDVVAELLELAVGRLEAERALDLHDDRARPRRGGLGVRRAAAVGTVRPVIAAIRPGGTTSKPPSTTGGSGEIWRFALELLQALLQPRLQVVGALARLAGVEPGVRPCRPAPGA